MASVRSSHLVSGGGVVRGIGRSSRVGSGGLIVIVIRLQESGKEKIISDSIKNCIAHMKK